MPVLEKDPGGVVRRGNVLKGGGKLLLETLLEILLEQFSRASRADMTGVGGLFAALLTVVGYRKKVILYNLKISGFAGNEGEAGLQRFYQYFGNLLAEMSASLFAPPSFEQGRVEVVGFDLLERAYDAGRPVVGLTTHGGNWEWLLIATTSMTHRPSLGVYQPLSNKFFDQLFLRMRSKSGATMIPSRTVVRETLSRRLTGPYGLALVADQAPDPAVAVPAKLGDASTRFYKGGGQLAQRLGADLLFFGMVPGHLPHTYKVTISKVAGDNAEAQAMEFARMLTEQIRVAPSAYLWSHNRFKHDRHLNPENEA